jgi:anaphase-promoting complex subunit 1
MLIRHLSVVIIVGLMWSCYGQKRELLGMIMIDAIPTVRLLHNQSNYRYASGRTMDKKTEVFIAHDLDGSELVCIHDKHSSILTGINVTALVNVRKGRGVKAFEFKASAAQPIRSTRHDYYDILLVQDGNLKLWISSGTSLVDLSLPHNISDLDTEMSLSLEQSSRKQLRTLVRQLSISEDTLSVINLKDPTHNRVNITLSNSRTYRITVDFTPKSTLVQDCLTALSFAVPINMFQHVRQRFMYHVHSEEQHTENSDTTADEWENFASAILCYLHGDESERSELREELQIDLLNASSNTWYLASHQNVMSNLNLGFKVQTLIGDQTDNELGQNSESLVKKWILHSLESCEKRNAEESLLTNIASVLLGLHIIWEDLRLDKSRKQDSVNLGLLLSQLAAMLQWEQWQMYYVDSGVPEVNFIHPGMRFIFHPSMLYPIC